MFETIESESRRCVIESFVLVIREEDKMRLWDSSASCTEHEKVLIVYTSPGTKGIAL